MTGNSHQAEREHFNGLQTLEPMLVNAARRLLQLCTQSLVVGPATADFDAQSPVFAMTSTHDFDFESFDRP